MNVNEKQRRIEETTIFFKQLYNKIPEPHFVYLWTKQSGIFSFSVADENQLVAMAQKAVELTDNRIDVWHCVNPVGIEPTNSKRGDEYSVSYQTAIVVDIDICSAAHKGDPSLLAADFNEAKSFLPFTPSLIIFSGYGLHAYFIFNQPIKITDDNREELKHRNNLLLDLIRARANGKKIDGVGDLPRVLRTPCTFNYKLGAENAPLCHIVEDSGLRFSPNQINDKLNSLIVTQKLKEIQSNANVKLNDYKFADDEDFNIFRFRRMLDFINPSTLTYDEWLAVGMALKNIGMECSDWKQWSRQDDRFKDGECQYKWNGFNRDGYEVGTLFHLAQLGGYDAKEIYREWYELHSDSKPSDKKKIDDDPATQIDLLNAELQSINKALSDFDKEKSAALEKLRNIEKFDGNTMFSKDVLIATAFAKLFDKQAFSNLKREIRNYGDKNRSQKISVTDWNADVKDKAEEILSRHNLLLHRRTEIKAEINSLSFAISDDVAKNITFPKGYSISKENGIEKVSGENMVTICRRPIIITGKTFSVEEKIYKVALAYMTQDGKWRELAPTEKAIVFNHRKLVDLANADLPVTSQNAAGLVEYFDAFADANEINFPLEYSVPRCGWYSLN